MEKVKGLLKSKLATILIAGFVGVGVGVASSDTTSLENELSTLKVDREKDLDTLAKQEEEIKALKEKVQEAKPFFDMAEAEQQAMKIEADKKLAEQKAEEERIAKEEEQKKLDAMSVTLGNGDYLVGKDIPEGVYDLYAVKGGGNVMSSDYNVNLIMGVNGDENFYQREQQNVALKEGTTIELSRVTVKFVPDFNYSVKK